MSREGDTVADASALLSNVALLRVKLGASKETTQEDTVALQRTSLAAITTQLEEHQRALAEEQDEPGDAMKRQLCQLQLERAARCTNLASSIEDTSESFELHKTAFEISQAVVQQMVQDTGGVDAKVFAQRKFSFPFADADLSDQRNSCSSARARCYALRSRSPALWQTR